MEYFTNFWDGLFWFIVLLTPLVFVHEMGHFLVARWCGVRVEVFSIGFGPELFGWTDRGRTRWKFSAIPLGGYIKMFGEHSLEAREDGEQRELTDAEKAVSIEHKRLSQRAAVVAAGPGANYLFAIVVLAAMFATIGQSFTPPRIGGIVDGMPAAEAGLRTGDRVVSVDGEGIERFEDLNRIIRLNPDRPLDIVVRRDGRDMAFQATPTGVEFEAVAGLTAREGDLGIAPYTPAIIGQVEPDSAAAEAGLQPGDRFISVDEMAIDDFSELSRIVAGAPNRPLTVVVLRGGDELSFNVVPRAIERKSDDGATEVIGLMGVRSLLVSEVVRLGPFAALWEGSVGVVDMTGQILKSIGQIFAGKRDSKELGGPIMIAQAAQDFSDRGLVQFLTLMAIFSVNLGLINLFPIPVLDGGHLLFYAIEAIRGRPLGEKAQEFSFKIGLALVSSLMIFVIFNDLLYRVL